MRPTDDLEVQPPVFVWNGEKIELKAQLLPIVQGLFDFEEYDEAQRFMEAYRAHIPWADDNMRYMIENDFGLDEKEQEEFLDWFNVRPKYSWARNLGFGINDVYTDEYEPPSFDTEQA